MTAILCFSSTDWKGWWGSRQQIMTRLAKRGYQIYYVEQSAGLEHVLKYPDLRERRRKQFCGDVSDLDDQIKIITPPILLPFRYSSLTINKINMWTMKIWIMKNVNIHPLENIILWMYKPEFYKLIGCFNELIKVYHCIDEPTVNTRGRKRNIIKLMDDQLVKNVDVVFANSLPTFQKKRKLNPNTYRIPSGVDYDLFKKANNPDTNTYPEILKIPPPRIGYCGRINERLDYETLEYLSQFKPNWSILFIGDTYPWTKKSKRLKQLSRYGNVYFLGKVPYIKMPEVIKGLDVCILPYVNDERGYYRSPLKLYEYLASGKPVVSMDHPEAKEFEDFILIANDKKGFIESVDCALREKSIDKILARQEIAKKHTWDKRVDMIESVLSDYL